MSQVCRREDLNWVSGKVSFRILQTFQYGHVGLPVIVENVPEERCQLMNLDRRGIDVSMSALAMRELVLSMPEACNDSGLSGTSS